MIQLENISKSYPDGTLFSNVNISLQRGVRAGLVGQNGSGKTTLLKMMLGKESTDSGNIKKEKNITIGYLEQEIIAGSGKSILEEVLTSIPEAIETEEKINSLSKKIKNDPNNMILVKKLGEYHSPTDKIVITSTYGHRWNRSHRGIDLDLQVWDPVHSAFKGKVRYAGFYGGYGRVVVVRHYNGLETLYAHLHRYKVAIGDEVEAGDVVGLGGSSGQSTGSHLHFECRFKGVAFDPATIIDFKNEKLIDKRITITKTKWGYAAIPDGVEYYTVKKGDYLYGIAEKYGTTCVKLCAANHINRNSTLQVGQKLRIL